ncbi:hypothetical protein LTR36_000366 [Oleoguttula mirabilis]|uniref:NAD(P)-binding protein n=1 Tax=Oleoguttula mirabilis TaxID=1507867 RepID=A0AAV9JYC2_9PEZI|nr:hypothetical protein LTR36_000366 [Oleoguttula mirabilis]
MLEWLVGKSFSPEKDISSLSGKVILVTGGNTGLGKETILQLAKHNPKEIFLAARTPSKAEAAIEDIKKAVPNSNISFLQLDLTSFSAVKKAADDFKARSDRLDILINNAGIMAVPWSTTKEGYEIQFGTNHMGHALFTKLLLPTMLKTAEQPGADVRIVNLSSEGHQMAPSPGIIYNQPDLEKCATWTRYGQSKLANILHAKALQKRYPSITTTSLHPGVIITDLYATMSGSYVAAKAFTAVARGVTSLGMLYDVPKGAKNQLWAATASKEEVRSSYYWKPVGAKSGGSKYAQNDELSEKLWEWTGDEFKKHGY